MEGSVSLYSVLAVVCHPLCVKEIWRDLCHCICVCCGLSSSVCEGDMEGSVSLYSVLAVVCHPLCVKDMEGSVSLYSVLAVVCHPLCVKEIWRDLCHCILC
eukprot:TRINITY_DN45609_c0_g1_i1.p1 TRINITY_DN45609_c0_g1~~TRINITY_DN45609_c0_g1_i1.p1  ORF type:complete len:101 (+),score=13.22 TRINITY_DN45609_c0_g1_i1:101-403(+)